VLNGLGIIEPGYAIAPSWLNSGIQPGQAGSSQLGGTLTTLSAAIDSSVTSVGVAKATTIPFATTYIVQVDNEQMLVTAVDTTSNTLTVTRGYNGTTAASHGAGANVVQSYGARADYVNVTLEYDHGIDAATGCAILFLYYLHIQLGFSINAICNAAPGVSQAGSCLRGVYQNLTGDDSDPFPFFKNLLDNAFPENEVTNVPGPNPDNPWPLCSQDFAVIMEPANVQEFFAAVMAPADQEWWWYVGQTADQVGQLLTQNNARLTDISAYVDVDNTVKYAVIMGPVGSAWWWYADLNSDAVAQTLAANNARLTVLTPYLAPGAPEPVKPR